MRFGSLLLMSLAGCAHLRPVTAEQQTLVTSRACAQGPLRIETQTLGARWGEWYHLRVDSPRGLKGHVRWRVADDRRPLEHWVTSFRVNEGKDVRLVVDTVFDQARCVERPAPVVVESPPVAPAPPVVVEQPAPAWAAPVPAVVQPNPGPFVEAPRVHIEVRVPMPAPQVVTQAERDFEPIPFPQGPDVAQVQLVRGNARSGEHSTTLMHWERRNEAKDAPAPVPVGQPVVIEIWSEHPNDYEGASFIFERGPLEPNVSEAEWLAELDSREAEQRRVDAEEAARVEAENKRRAEAHAARVEVDNERRRREQLELERRRAEHLAARVAATPKVDTAYEQERRARYVTGLAPPSRADEGYVEARRQAFERRQAEAAAEAEARRRWEAESERRWREAEARRPKPRPQPTGPPPPAPAQVVPPRPAPYVVWVDGYYEWTGATWVWLEGWWKVNEVERRRYEVAASLPAPTARDEARPPCPVPEAEWQAGTWVWNLEAWVWLPGVWLSTQRPVHRAVPVTPKP